MLGAAKVGGARGCRRVEFQQMVQPADGRRDVVDVPVDDGAEPSGGERASIREALRREGLAALKRVLAPG
jgi:hypothetical protein